MNPYPSSSTSKRISRIPFCSRNPFAFLPTNPISKTTPVTSKTFNSNQLIRNITDKTVKLAFPTSACRLQ
ncbi:hypothetical protein CEXT_517261 [Caerostris extrusa]|uniref:Uncharacterized protein n=1 Tax=Caerostris extrusa TaxID=172846 RepID=A0AAV4V4M0_CAEEX|nr:hypothetical protein CEXT_517261 [Caerostris extrusa]